MTEQELKTLWQAINQSSNCENCYTIETIEDVLAQYTAGVKSGSLPNYDPSLNSAEVANMLVKSTGETSGRIQKILFYMNKLGQQGLIAMPNAEERWFLGMTTIELALGLSLGFIGYFIYKDITS